MKKRLKKKLAKKTQAKLFRFILSELENTERLIALLKPSKYDIRFVERWTDEPGSLGYVDQDEPRTKRAA